MPPDDIPRPAIQKPHRFPLIWIIPIVAVLIALWLGYHALSQRGPMIAIVMQNAEGIEAGKTRIEHRNIELGMVESVTPNAGLASVTVQARMTRYAEDYLTQGTRFWVVRPRLSAEGISGLSTLISGSYVEMEPGPGAQAHRFVALEDPPVISAEVPGTQYVLHSQTLGSVSQGAPISFHGVRVGEILGYQLSDEDGGATIQIFVRAPHDKLIHEGTRFWNVSGISVNLNSEGVRLQTDSLQAILAGGIAFDVPPGGEAGPSSPPSSVFTLYPSQDEAHDALFTHKIPFMIHLTGSAQGLSVGATVRMHGIRVGAVRDVHMEYDETTDQLTVPVTFDLEPQRVKILNSTLKETDFDARSYAVFERFVARGLRARLASGNLLTGQKIVSLDFVPEAPRAKMIQGGLYPEIPALASDDLDTLIGSAKSLLSSLQGTADGLTKVIASPEVKQSLRSLEHSLANVDTLTHQVDVQIGPLLEGLRAVSASADQTLKEATGTLAVTRNALDGDASGNSNLAALLGELKQAARSLRTLTDYLEAHPESLIQGKAGGARP